MKTILAVDGHPVALEGVHTLLSRHGFGVFKARSAGHAAEIAGLRAGIDMIVTGLPLSGRQGSLALIDSLRPAGIRVPAIIHTVTGELRHLVLHDCPVVHGVVLKTDDTAELVAAVKAVAGGGSYFSAAYEARLREARLTAALMSEKDIDILSRLASGAGNREIAAAMGISEKTVEYHRSGIMRKLCARNMAEAVRRAIGLGLISA